MCNAEVDASKRYTAEQALAHPWVTGQRTPNKFLRSPNYLATIKKERAAARRMNGNGAGGNATGGADGAKTALDQEAMRINNRRQSH